MAQRMIHDVTADFPIPCPDATAARMVVNGSLRNFAPTASSRSHCHVSGPSLSFRIPSPQLKAYRTNPTGSS